MMPTDSIQEEDFEAALTLLHISQGRWFTPAEREAAWTLLQVSKQQKKRTANESQLEEVKTGVEAVKKQSKKRKHVEEDDSDETQRRMLEWNSNKPDKPSFVFEVNELGVCSKPLRKQLTESDVKVDQCRLMLGKTQVKKMMLEVMGTSDRVGTNGLEVSVYGPDREREVYKMMFKMWNGDTPVLTSIGWKKFVKDYDLKMHSDFLTIWMFKHKETRKLCFAIESRTFPSQKQLSKRITKAVF